MAPGTVHRGITNRSDYVRCYLLIVVDQQPVTTYLENEQAMTNKGELCGFIETYGGSFDSIVYEPAVKS